MYKRGLLGGIVEKSFRSPIDSGVVKWNERSYGTSARLYIFPKKGCRLKVRGVPDRVQIPCRSGSRNAEVAESPGSIVLSMNVDKTPIDNKVKYVECDSPFAALKLGQVLSSKQSSSCD